MFGPTQTGPRPTDSHIDLPITRRRFVKLAVRFSVVSTMALIVTPVIAFLLPSRRAQVGAGGRLLAGTTAEIPVGRSKVVAMGAKPVIVVNSPQDGVRAFSAVCTHLGCIVGYDQSQSGDIVSPCHNGHFSTFDGRVLSGPPPAPLAQYTVAIEGDDIFVAAPTA